MEVRKIILYNTMEVINMSQVTFASVNNIPRPVRLSEATRQFAYDSLNHKYGLDTMQTFGVAMDDVAGQAEMTPMQWYDAAIALIADTAPVRICPDEMISGAATLGGAISHAVPATLNGQLRFGSVSHLTIDFADVLKRGLEGLRQDAEAALKVHMGTEQEPFARSCISCLDSFDRWHARYLKALEGKPEYAANLENLKWVPHKPARNFYEAVQSIWMVFAFVRLCGNWPGFGRIDWLLGDYLKADLASGKLTLEEAREILAHFFIKGCEWICGGDYESGDAQHYQNILIAGIDESGEEIANEVTYLVLDILEELGISDFPTSVRLNSKTPEKLLRRVAEVMRLGGGILAVYNEDLVLECLEEYGYDPKEAVHFANDGCWEVQVPGKTFFRYIPFDSLALLQQNTLKSYDQPLEFENFEALYEAYAADLKQRVADIVQEICHSTFDPASNAQTGFRWLTHEPCTVVSIFEKGCIQRGLSYSEGGPIYEVCSPHIGGLADTVNSLYAIKKLVYDDAKCTLPELLDILKNNWEGNEALRKFASQHYAYYENDNDEVDLLAARLLNDFADACDAGEGYCGFRFPAGVSTFGRQLNWAPNRLASPHGHKAGEVLAANCSPTPGSDKEGATAIIRSYCKADMKRMVTGAALDIRLLPSSVAGEGGLQALMGLMRGFVALGGYFMQPDVADVEVLRQAQACPEEHQTLSVRVSGWNARFVTLNKEWQDMVIAQNETARG